MSQFEILGTSYSVFCDGRSEATCTWLDNGEQQTLKVPLYQHTLRYEDLQDLEHVPVHVLHALWLVLPETSPWDIALARWCA